MPEGDEPMAERVALTDTQKQQILERDGWHCFIDGHPIDSEKDIQFDHIRPVAAGGPTEVENLAVVCRKHNQRKGKQSLSEYRDQLELESFFKDGRAKYLDDVIAARDMKSGTPLLHDVAALSDRVALYFDSGKSDVSLYICPTTGWKYFYALVPIVHLMNDKDLQPRPLRQKPMLDLYRHFRRNTQLAPSICRLESDGRLLLFDGQHKAAAQIWSGRKVVECKVYISPDPKRLKETNLEAHEAYRQMGFYSSELMAKYADIFGEDWNVYTQTEGEKSEAGFISFLVETKGYTATKARKEVERAIHHRILDDTANKLKDFTSDKTRTKELPLTHNRIQKTLFRDFLSAIPNRAEFDSPEDMRSTEEQNLVRLMSIIAEEGLVDRWDPERNDAVHRKAERIFSAGSVRAWVRLLRDVLYAGLELWKISPEEVNRMLYRPISEEQFTWIRQFVRRIFSHSVWETPDTPEQNISMALTKDDDTTAANLLKERGLVMDWVIKSPGS
jgi:hypothetical protein